MNANTTRDRFDAARERHRILRSATDRELLDELKRRKGLCAEAGCREKAWHGREYCLWHPTLQLAPRTGRRTARPPMVERAVS